MYYLNKNQVIVVLFMKIIIKIKIITINKIFIKIKIMLRFK